MERNRTNGPSFLRHNPRRVAWLVAAIFAGCLLNLWAQTNTLRKNLPSGQKKEQFTRPKPTRPIVPEIPSQDRYVSNKVFLERADSLYHNPSMEDRQVVSGNVMFRQGNMFMYCDSAYYFADNNSLFAFGNVKMTSGDTLKVYADRMFYDGMQKLARLRNGRTRSQVEVNNRNTTLTADSLYYSVAMGRGWYDCGGRLEDNLNILTSQYGEYTPALKSADFFGNVHLRSKRNGNQLFTDTLYYNTGTQVARIVSMTRIYSPTDTIITYNGSYNTRTGYAQLNSRSTIIHTDSNNNATMLTGDIIIYDRAARLSKAYMFDDPTRNPKPVVLLDTAHKVRLISEYGEYDDARRSAFATGHPLLVEYSRPDTNYLRADTIYTWIVNHLVQVPYTEEQQLLYDTLMERQKALNLIADSLQRAYQHAIEEGDTTAEPPPRVDLIDDEPSLKRDSVQKEFSIAKAIGRARFFNQQIQGIADTLHLIQFDSLLYMKRKPIVWSDERQVTGDTIVVHFNDSTADRARVVNGFTAEHVAEDFYNQMKGKKMFATFHDNSLEHLEVDDNVEVIMLPVENDSTYNKLIRAESAHLTVDMNGNDLSKLKMWSAVDGQVIPLFKIKPSEQFLQGFQWQEALRPRREWYFGRWVWDDDQGDVSDELDEYFKDPPPDLEKYFD